MIGLILLYFIGRKFYELAFEFEKNKWLWAIIGIVCYYAGGFVGGFAIAGIAIGLDKPQILEANQILLGLIAMPFGLLACWGLYTGLKRNWGKKSLSEPEIIDSDMI